MENDHLDIWVKISTQIGELNSSIKACLDKLTNHENRLTRLETTQSRSLKDDLLHLALKGLVVAIIALGSVTGAGALIGKFLGL